MIDWKRKLTSRKFWMAMDEDGKPNTPARKKRGATRATEEKNG